MRIKSEYKVTETENLTLQICLKTKNHTNSKMMHLIYNRRPYTACLHMSKQTVTWAEQTTVYTNWKTESPKQSLIYQ